MHSASLGILAGLAAVVWIAFLVPHQTSRNASPTTAGGSAEAATDSAEAAGSSAHGGAVAARPADRLKIPQLGVNAPVITVGLLPGGAMDAPKTLWQVGWYKNSAKPGGTGTAIIDGHAGAPNQVGVLENLNRLRTGDKFSYAYLDGRTINFRVTSSKAYPLNTDTIAKLYSPTGPKSLNLISCYGKYNSQTNDYAQRWIVTAVTD